MESYKELGSKTYWLFLSKRLSGAFTFFLIFIAISIARIIHLVPADMYHYVRLASLASFVIFVISTIVAFATNHFVYKSYGYCLSEDALKIKSGVFNSKEIAIPYRQIQSINIERTFTEQMMGLSRIIVSSAGSDDLKTEGDESKGVLPAIDKYLALELQDRLLEKADVQKVIETK